MFPQARLNHLYHHTTIPALPYRLDHYAVRVAAAQELTDLHAKLENFLMPRKASKSTDKSWTVEFSTLRLSAADKKDFIAWAKNHADDMWMVYYPDLLQSGIKCSMSYDSDNDCFIFSMTCKDPSSENHNVCMVSRAGSHEEAMLIGLYKHMVICDNQAWPVRGSDDWG